MYQWPSNVDAFWWVTVHKFMQTKHLFYNPFRINKAILKERLVSTDPVQQFNSSFYNELSKGLIYNSFFYLAKQIDLLKHAFNVVGHSASCLLLPLALDFCWTSLVKKTSISLFMSCSGSLLLNRTASRCPGNQNTPEFL